MNTPLLSVIVPTRNRRRLLERCLQSLAEQDESNEFYEVIVVDDGSTDDTAACVRARAPQGPALRCVSQPWRGIPSARNAGIEVARGVLVAFVADDYVLPSNYVSHVLTFFREQPNADAARFQMVPAEVDYCSRVSHFYFDVDIRNNLHGAPGRDLAPAHVRARQLVQRLPAHGNRPTTDHRLSASGAAVFRIDLFDTIGTFDTRFDRAEDSELALRMRRHGVLLVYDPRLEIQRSYPSSIGEALRAEATAGYHLARFEGLALSRSTPRLVGRAISRVAIRPLWRARQCDSARQAASYLPLLLAMELAHLAGYACGAIAPEP